MFGPYIEDKIEPRQRLLWNILYHTHRQRRTKLYNAIFKHLYCVNKDYQVIRHMVDLFDPHILKECRKIEDKDIQNYPMLEDINFKWETKFKLGTTLEEVCHR